MSRVLTCEQGSQEWIEARLGIPTASCFSKIVTPKEMKLSKSADEYLAQLVAEWMLGQPVDDAGSLYMDRGREMERDAVDWYEMRYDVEVQRVGLVLLDDGSAGASPDGLIGADGGLEIKCPGAVQHVRYLLGEPPTKYMAQIQGGLWVTGRQWWDFLSYHPTMPKVVLRVARDPAFMAAFDRTIPAFLSTLADAKQTILDMGFTPRPTYSAVAAQAHDQTPTDGVSAGGLTF